MSYLPFSKRVARSLASANNLSAEQEEIITYGLELLVLNLLNLIATLLVGFMLGVFSETIFCALTVMVFRQVAGGAHSNSPWRCLLVTASVIPILSLAGKFLATEGQAFINILSIMTIVIGFLVIIKYAPSDTPEAPCLSPARKRKMKNLSIFAILTFSLIIGILSYPSFTFLVNIKVSIVLAMVWISFILTPIGYSFMSHVDMIHIKR
ncbi:accessory gene regulator B [Desulfonispora thiosulfatigenes DSM 11270]|uniref:Accessory gene regulator B n=2 Tax=Desulfonispora thiosulfatigenes TaxID=83661 RepID=A0A1W1V3U9_DESTI|nr:accessory gene regulator B [Desulfonispora thiosulfatigenes DSM 11270]